MTDTNQRLKEIRERCDRATEGPWVYNQGGPHDDGVILTEKKYPPMYAYEDGPQQKYIAQTTYDTLSTTQQHNIDEDGEFIANARADIPFLLELCELLQKEKDEMFDKASYITGKQAQAILIAKKCLEETADDWHQEVCWTDKPHYHTCQKPRDALAAIDEILK